MILTWDHSSNAQTSVNVVLVNVDIDIEPGLMRLIHDKAFVDGHVSVLAQSSAQLSETVFKHNLSIILTVVHFSGPHRLVLSGPWPLERISYRQVMRFR